MIRCAQCNALWTPGPGRPQQGDAFRCDFCGGGQSVNVPDTEPPPTPRDTSLDTSAPELLTDPVDDGAPLITTPSDAPPDVFVSTSIYAMVKELGPHDAIAEFARQLESPDQSSLPVVRAIHRLRGHYTVGLHLDAGATVIAKVRSRAAHAALASKAKCWLAIDDDVEADTTALKTMVEWTMQRWSVVLAPCWVRDQNRVQVALKPPGLEPEAADPTLLPCWYGGFGLVAVGMPALQRIAECNQRLSYIDDDEVERLALFHEELIEVPRASATEWSGKRRWLGEDLTFFLRIPADVTVRALAKGVTSHQGRPLILSRLRELPTWDVNPAWPRVQSATGEYALSGPPRTAP